MEKEQYRESRQGLKISHLCFGIPSSFQIQKQSQLQCVNKTLYDDAISSKGSKNKAAPYSVLDTRLGTSQNGQKCETCGDGLAECVGHFGHIDLALPIFHVGYFRFIMSILQTICKRCARVLIANEVRVKYLNRLRKPELSYLEKKSLHKEICDKCKKIKVCSFCGYLNGTVKKVGLYKVAHLVPKPTVSRKDKNAEIEELSSDLLGFIEENKEMEDYIRRCKAEFLDPLRVQNLFKEIPTSDYCYLLIKDFHPSDLILNKIPVPPACIRPSVLNELESGSNEDDLTIKLSEIIFVNDVIQKRRSSGASIAMIIEDWDFLQLQIALYINSETSGIPLNMRPKKLGRGLVQRLKGKHGRFRGNLSGKRVDFSSRSVISPNPNLKIDEVGVPKHIAKILTFPEKVTPANIAKMKALVTRGADEHPGANFVEDKKTGNKIFLKYANRRKIASEIKYGDVVERHLDDGDVVMFNRQPSLHKLSIMSHKARVHDHRTFQFNECVCTPYNADFDGDEMNLHLLQTEEAKAEAYILMGILSNIITPRNGEPLIAAIQDFITGGYLLTQKDSFFDRSKACQLISSILGEAQGIDKIILPRPCILKPKALWSGKQIFSLILKPVEDGNPGLDLRTKSRNYSGKNEELCANDGFVNIRDSELLCGTMDKATLGSGSKTNVFYIMLRDLNAAAAGMAMWRLARVTSYYLANRGFSLGLEDVTPTEQLLYSKKSLLTTGYRRVNEYISDLKDGKLERLPGRSAEDTLESMILKELSVIRDHAGKSCLKELSVDNAALVMAMSGSKGSLINVSQMVACVGQQAIRGGRVPDGFGGRSLPHFAHRDKSPLAKGFVENSFYSGLTVTEFFFHTMAGREGLLDTAVKTAETGYMQRRLVKALEDLVSHYDGSVRNSRGEVIQFIYGDDSLDPACMEDNDKPVNFDRMMLHVATTHPSEIDPSLDPGMLIEKSKQQIDRWSSNISDSFKTEVRLYIETLANKLAKFRSNYICDDFNNVLGQVGRITESQLIQFLTCCEDKYLRAKLEPGTAVGAICAQSIGEPATQMTLKTFHFAGVASMNITQGVPRIKELINANKTISTPVIRAALLDPKNGEEARAVKMRLEKTTLGQICEFIEEVILPDDCFVLIKLYMDRVKLLKLEVDVNSISSSILRSLKIQSHRIKIYGRNLIQVHSGSPSELWQLRESICNVVVKGIPSLKRAAIRMEGEAEKSKHYLMIEGEGLRDVMATYGVDPNHSYSNNVMEIASCLGIEAARASIIKEIKVTMENHGISIDSRHLKLLADTMTYRGEVLGITRFGLAKMKESALMLASFEKTADHLFDAAYFCQKDPILGVSESIISGMPIRIGTGFFDLIRKQEFNKSQYFDRKLIFEDEELHEPFNFEVDPRYFQE
ncbi:DNA-directed RNA polymerase III subunit RPC1 [Tetranychus urticae]|uniref:DNA-directed RNA polymerase subunit n=1 Tax=Tetranychus urticae TaxID=32264 RepID=T1KIR4_TETUR|nr:DNA-directed RNA polymerase III subunit RPC1 [Tetranychus urticae]